MTGKEKIIITNKEAAELLGVKSLSMKMIERKAGIRDDSRRLGFTEKELHRLLSVMRHALGLSARSETS